MDYPVCACLHQMQRLWKSKPSNHLTSSGLIIAPSTASLKLAAIHAVGTATSVACLLACVAKRKWHLLPLSLVPGYGAAWAAHFLIEKNKPATFDYPLWSFMADYKMVAMMIQGTLDDEIKRLVAVSDQRG